MDRVEGSRRDGDEGEGEGGVDCCGEEGRGEKEGVRERNRLVEVMDGFCEESAVEVEVEVEVEWMGVDVPVDDGVGGRGSLGLAVVGLTVFVCVLSEDFLPMQNLSSVSMWSCPPKKSKSPVSWLRVEFTRLAVEAKSRGTR